MIDRKYYFLITPKLVIFSVHEDSVLLCQRKGEKDYDGVYSFAGGKLEIHDKDIVAGIKREKDEELGDDFKIELNPSVSTSVLYQKSDGDVIYVPHYYARHSSGEIKLNEQEYSKYQWVDIGDVAEFEPKIPTVGDVVVEMTEDINFYRNKLVII